jgi:exopolysaccharide production protein ExoZ
LEVRRHARGHGRQAQRLARHAGHRPVRRRLAHLPKDLALTKFAPKPGFDGIQGLRALAALSVAFLHVADEAGALSGTPGRAPYLVLDQVPLEAGVDLFFVISGFVMVWASWAGFGRLASVGPFVWRRLLRIVPLYWLLSAATVLIAIAAPGIMSDGLRDGWGYVATSFAFIPWRRMDGSIQPILRLGWTLEYEMLFYAIVACALPLRRPIALAAILLAIAALALAGQALPLTTAPAVFWTDPIVLEFAFGALVAIAARQGWRAGWPGLAALLVALIVAILFGDGHRVLARGIPAALLVFCALSWRGLPAWLLLVGNASYALYLVHPFPMRAVRVIFARMALPPGVAIPAYLIGTMLLCTLLAIALHLLVEQPISRRFRRGANVASPYERADATIIGE